MFYIVFDLYHACVHPQFGLGQWSAHVLSWVTEHYIIQFGLGQWSAHVIVGSQNTVLFADIRYHELLEGFYI